MTRNMLSALEHDTANPSINTLKYLSEKLCKPIGYFLGETIPGEIEMTAAREAFQTGQYAVCLKILEEVDQPAFQNERLLLQILCTMELAEAANAKGKNVYCIELLRSCEKMLDKCPYMQAEFRRKHLILLAKAVPAKERTAVIKQIPAEEEIMLLRAQAAMELGEYDKAKKLLEAMEKQDTAQWNMLRGDLWFREGEYAKSAKCFHAAEEHYPEITGEKLEICYREMGDYKMAYYYAKKVKTGKRP